MVVNRLRGSEASGNILLEGVMGNSYVANLTLIRLDDNMITAKLPEPKKPNITNWKLSPAFEKSNLTVEEYRSIKDTVTNWQAIVPNTDGFVNLATYFLNPRGTIIATTTILATEDTLKKLLFDYTKGLQIVLNDSIVFNNSGNSALVKDGRNIQVLPLKKGTNELAFIVTGDYKYWESISYKHFNNYQSFNWGFRARIEKFISTSLVNLPESEQLKIFPNPGKGIINISLGTIQYKTAVVEVTDISGKIVASEIYHNCPTITIDLIGNAKGIYFINLLLDGEKFNRKVCLE
jgi:hypothetical protein